MQLSKHPKIADRVPHALKLTAAVATYRKRHGHYPSPSRRAAVGHMGRWLAGRRQVFKNTTASGIWYPECEALAIELGCPDMFNFDQKAALLTSNLDKTRKVAAYFHRRGIFPAASAKTGTARKLANWLNGMRGAKCQTHKKSRTWHPQCEALAKALDVPEMFNYPIIDRLTPALENTRKLCEYWNEHGRYPKSFRHNTNKKEQKLMNFRSSMRFQRIMGYPPFEKEWRMACEKLAIELGCPNLFIPTNHEEVAINNTLAVIKYIKTHGGYPTAQDKTLEARRLAYWYNRAIRTRNGYDIRYNWYPECESVAEALGEPELFLWRNAPWAENVTTW